jgi:hypothetical protein
MTAESDLRAQKSAAEATRRAQTEIDRLTAERTHLIAQVCESMAKALAILSRSFYMTNEDSSLNANFFSV